MSLHENKALHSFYLEIILMQCHKPRQHCTLTAHPELMTDGQASCVTNPHQDLGQ